MIFKTAINTAHPLS